MLAELILTHALASTVPAVPRTSDQPYLTTEVRLSIRSGFGWRWALRIEPYVLIHDREPMAGGGEAELSWAMSETVSVELYHRSEHAFDRASGQMLEFDAVRVRVRLP